MEKKSEMIFYSVLYYKNKYFTDCESRAACPKVIFQWIKHLTMAAIL